MPLPTKVSDAFRRLNPHLYGGATEQSARAAAAQSKKRIRQTDGDGMNKTEREFLEHIKAHLAAAQSTIHREVSLPIANGVRYKVDFLVGTPSEKCSFGVDAYEVKGKHAWDDAIVKLKVAARVFPWIRFYLASRAPAGAAWTAEGQGRWTIERVHP